jgi:hypothetical protein
MGTITIFSSIRLPPRRFPRPWMCRRTVQICLQVEQKDGRRLGLQLLLLHASRDELVAMAGLTGSKTKFARPK